MKDMKEVLIELGEISEETMGVPGPFFEYGDFTVLNHRDH